MPYEDSDRHKKPCVPLPHTETAVKRLHVDDLILASYIFTS